MRWLLPLVLLGGCGSPEGTWLFALDRDAGSGCSDELGGTVQYEVALLREGEQASAWISELGAVLSGSWSKDGVLDLDESDAQSFAPLSINAQVSGRELEGTWAEPSASCTQTVPLTGRRLSDADVLP